MHDGRCQITEKQKNTIKEAAAASPVPKGASSYPRYLAQARDHMEA